MFGFRHRPRWTLLCAITLAVLPVGLGAQSLTTPRAALGFDLGDDYQLATYEQLQAYWARLAAESPRMVLEEIGKTEEGRPQLMAIITSPENQRNLDRYRDISRRLARAEDLTDAQARQLASEGKAVVWIDGGLHATEVLGAQQLMRFVYDMVSLTDPETMRFLDDVIVLAVHANPDGMELVSNWYMRNDNPTQRASGGIPRLYQKYVGHDNNRDFYMSTQAETINMNRIMYRTWYPQIVYNHHQTGPAGTVMFAPPFRDPFNYNYDPLIPLSIEAVGTAMHSRFAAEGKPGTTMRTGASYSTWWNGGLRTTPYFHNMIGLLTETIGNPTPVEIPFIPSRQLPHNDLPFPVPPQTWHFIQSIEYSQTANRAVLDYASRNRELLMYNIYQMGRNAIQRGSQDHWTVQPKRIQAVEAAARNSPARPQGFGGGNRLPSELYDEILRAPEWRDPRGYILSANQSDFPTATKFMNVLIRNGVTVHRARSSFTVSGKQYPAGSYVVKTAQAFRPFVMDMFEPQDHPNDFAYPGGPPISPYDNTGWTVAFQMGVDFDRILDGFDGPFERIDDELAPPAGAIANAGGATGYLLGHEYNDGFKATNRLLARGHDVYWLSEPFTSGGTTWPAGTIYIPDASGVRGEVEQAARELGLTFQGLRTAPTGKALQMGSTRVGLWDEYGGSMPSGWLRWIMEQFEFPYEVVYPQELDAGDLRSKFDVIVLASGAVPSVRAGGGGGGGGGFGGRQNANIPAEFQNRLGDISPATMPALQAFLESGGTVITIGTSMNLAYHLDLPVENYLVDYEGNPLTREQFFVPGSVLRVKIDNTQPVAWGVESEVDVHFNNSPVLKLRDSMTENLKPIGWFDGREPLRSGWAWGQHYLNGGVTMIEGKVGAGTLYMFGPEITRRAQPHGTFKFLFNGIYLGGASEVDLASVTDQM